MHEAWLTYKLSRTHDVPLGAAIPQLCQSLLVGFVSGVSVLGNRILCGHKVSHAHIHPLQGFFARLETNPDGSQNLMRYSSLLHSPHKTRFSPLPGAQLPYLALSALPPAPPLSSTCCQRQVLSRWSAAAGSAVFPATRRDCGLEACMR